MVYLASKDARNVWRSPLFQDGWLLPGEFQEANRGRPRTWIFVQGDYAEMESEIKLSERDYRSEREKAREKRIKGILGFFKRARKRNGILIFTTPCPPNDFLKRIMRREQNTFLMLGAKRGGMSVRLFYHALDLASIEALDCDMPLGLGFDIQNYIKNDGPVWISGYNGIIGQRESVGGPRATNRHREAKGPRHLKSNSGAGYR